MHLGPVRPPRLLLFGGECKLRVRNVLYMLEFEVKFGLGLLYAFLFVLQEQSAVVLECYLPHFVDIGLKHQRAVVVLSHFIRVNDLSVSTEETSLMEINSIVEKFSRFFALNFTTRALCTQHDAAYWDLALEWVSVANVVVISIDFP